MSSHVVSWVLRHSEARGTDRLVLIVLADRSAGDNLNAYPSVATIAKEARLSARATRYALRSLEAAGHIEHVGDGPGGTRSYRVVTEGASERRGGGNSVPPGTVCPPARFAPKRTAVSKTAEDSQPTEDNRSTTTVGQKRADGLPKKIGRAATTKRERDTAVAVVAIWNELAGTNVTARAWAAKVIGRLRHLTETRSADAAHDLAAHRKLIEAALADPWWTGRPSPAVVYGNDRVFEATVERARDGGGRDELGIHRMRRWIDELEAA